MKNLYGYDFLIESFVNGNISAQEFEKRYLDKFLRDKDPIDEKLFLHLDWLFAEVDGFSNDAKTFPESYVSEKQLHESALKTLQDLKALR